MNIVFLDGHALNPKELNWDSLKKLGHLTIFDHTPSSEVIERSKEAEVIILNKKRMSEEIFKQLPKLRLILVAATGYDVVDTIAAHRYGVTVCNVPAYSTLAVAQHTLALMLEHTNRVGHYARLNREGYWSKSSSFCIWDKAVVELSGKRVALVGFGNIGQKVAQLLQVLEAEVCAVTSKSQECLPAGITRISLEEAFSTSDVISLHCPLTAQNRGFVNADLLKLIRPGMLLINTARGGLIDDIAVAAALSDGRLGGYACDVLSVEPPSNDHPILLAPNTLVTPHIAWASAEARQRIIDVMSDNLEAFIKGAPIHVVTPTGEHRV